MVFSLAKVRSEIVPKSEWGFSLGCRFAVVLIGNGHLFWECTDTLPVEMRENLEFHAHVRTDKRHWPRCLIWHGRLPVHSLQCSRINIVLTTRILPWKSRTQDRNQNQPETTTLNRAESVADQPRKVVS